MNPTRRTLLKAFLLGVATPILSRPPALSQNKPANPTAAENQKAGTTGWHFPPLRNGKSKPAPPSPTFEQEMENISAHFFRVNQP